MARIRFSVTTIRVIGTTMEYQKEFYSDETIYLLYHASGTQYGPSVRKVTSFAKTEFVEATDHLLQIHDLFYGFPEH